MVQGYLPTPPQSFHSTGRHVLSAGHDQFINLVSSASLGTDPVAVYLLTTIQWSLPDIPNKHVDTPQVLYYPHFATCEVHGNLVDW